MSSVWISRDSWNKVWSALHNIRVRQSHTVKTACATLSGAGTSARINIDLPEGRGGGDYTGMFQLGIDTLADGTDVLVCRDGMDEDSEFCGLCDSGSLRGWVKKTILELPEIDSDVILMALITSTGLKTSLMICDEMPLQGEYPDDYDGEKPSDLQSIRHILIGRIAVDQDSGEVTLVQEHRGAILLDAEPRQWPFTVTLDAENDMLQIAEGYYICNGKFGVAPSGKIASKTGTLCLKMTLKDGEIEPPKFVVHDPDIEHYPLAAIEVKNGSVAIRQYPVTVAVFQITRKCIFALRKT